MPVFDAPPVFLTKVVSPVTELMQTLRSAFWMTMPPSVATVIGTIACMFHSNARAVADASVSRTTSTSVPRRYQSCRLFSVSAPSKAAVASPSA
ncbi:hypothetical protein D3C72_2365850 [compost metagenome]